MSDPTPVRVRIAPSPTGEVHIGTIWIALFQKLYAQQRNGTFVLRIEDTDRQRLVPGSVERIYEALDWYGLTPDEGPMQGGQYGPYVQSERLPTYREHALQLVASKNAYYCFCTPIRLAALRAQQAAAKQAPRYDKQCRSLSEEEATHRIKAGEPHVIRLDVPRTGTVVHEDLIRGRVTFSFDQIDDAVLLKSDGFPTYHLAVVVDDHLMRISHIIRAEEWLPSVPKHLLLYRLFGWELPVFAHMPMILGTDRKKLSKRHGATSALSFRDEGYLPEAMRNFLVLMGWHPKGDREVLTPEELLREFTIEAVNPSGAIFDRTKLDWMNGWYLRKLPVPELVSKLTQFWHLPEGATPGDEWKVRAVTIVRDRMKRLSEADSMLNFLFPSAWDSELAAFDRAMLLPKKGTVAMMKDALTWAAAWLNAWDGAWDAKVLKDLMIAAIASAGRKNVDILWPLRVALTLRTASPDVFDVLSVLGKPEALRRVRHFVKP